MGEDEDDSAMEPEMVKNLVALEGARYLQRVIKENDVLGVTWGSTVYQMINYLNPAQKCEYYFRHFTWKFKQLRDRMGRPDTRIPYGKSLFRQKVLFR